MTNPRPIYKGTTYLITRRCTQRQLLLRPCALNNQIFLYCLAMAAERTGVLVHGVCVLSNHYHAVVTDPQGRIPEMTHYLHEYVSKCINTSLGRWENMWSNEQPSMVALTDDKDVLDKLVYTLANPVQAFLVAQGDQWPGVRTTPQDMLNKPIPCTRPPVFFSEKGSTKGEVLLEIRRPKIFKSLNKGKFVALLQKAIQAKETELRSQAKEKRIRFLGVRKVRAQQSTDTPRTIAPRRNLKPRVAAKSKWSRIEALRRLTRFIEDYRCEWLKWSKGIRDVLFPKGTYALVRFASVPHLT